MKTMRSVTALIATTMLATSVTPAMAQSFPGNGYGYNYGDRYRHHRDRGVSAGDVIAGVAIIGIIAAIAGAASKSNNRNYNGNINSERQAADACASRIEQRYGNSAQVRGIDDVQRTSEGYYVRGTVETNDRYSQGTQQFTCSVRYGQVDDVRIDSGYAYRGY